MVVGDGDLHVSVDEEGVVRVENLGENEAVLLTKDVLEGLLTRVYEYALADVKASERSR